MPAARKVVTRSPKRNVGLINCPWFQGQSIEHESRLEKHFVLRSILFPGLRSIQHQPFTMPLKVHGERYTPDFLLTFDTGEELVFEVKRSERIKEHKERFDEIADLCRQANLCFCVVHQVQIDGQRRAERAALIRRYAMHHVAPALTQEIEAFVCQGAKGIPIQKLKKRFGLTQESVLALVANRRITLSKDLLISDEALVYPTNLEIKNASVQFGSWFGCAPWIAAIGIPQPVAGQQDPATESTDTLGSGHEVFDFPRGGHVQEDPTGDW